MIKVTFKTQDGTYWAVCENLRYVRGSGYFMERITEDSCSPVPGAWSKTPEEWKLLSVREV